jgi:opacity protein-like surface antigen
MIIKSLLLGSAAALAAVSGAQAADAIVAAEPEPMEYVRVCDAFGTGYFYIPGSETCLKVGGRVRFDAKFNDAYNLNNDGSLTNTRAEIYMSSASDTEWGALKTNMTARFDYSPRNSSISGYEENTRTRLMVATIELAGFTVGLQDSLFEQVGGTAGPFISDDLVNFGPSEVAMIAYTYKANGLTAYLAVEDDGTNHGESGGSDAPNVTGGFKYDTGVFSGTLVAGYDESEDAVALKSRLDAKFGAFNAWVMGGWNSDGDSNNSYAPVTNYGVARLGWGDWAVWGGGGYKFTSKLGANVQAAYTDTDVLEVAANLQWTPAAGFLIQPEVTYTSIDHGSVDQDQWTGAIRFQRTF